MGFSGAGLQGLLNEAALLAAREQANAVSSGHLCEGIERVAAGIQRVGMVRTCGGSSVCCRHCETSALKPSPHSSPCFFALACRVHAKRSLRFRSLVAILQPGAARSSKPINLSIHRLLTCPVTPSVETLRVPCGLLAPH